jgi:AmpE protein
MRLLAMLIALGLHRFVLDGLQLQDPPWVQRYLDWFRRPGPAVFVNGRHGAALLLAPPLLGVALVQDWLDAPLLALGLGTVAALWALGPGRVDRAAVAYVDARDRGDGIGAQRLARAICADEVPAAEPARSQAIARRLFVAANSRAVAPLAWFLVLGPFGAVLYRCAAMLDRQAAYVPPLAVPGALRLRALLDWPTARLTALLFGLAGDYPATRHAAPMVLDREVSEAAELLIRSGEAASGAYASDEDAVEVALQLVERAQLFVAAALAVLLLTVWAVAA